MTELHEAVRAGNLARVRNILRGDPTCVNDRNANYETPLHVVYDFCVYTEQSDDRLPIIQTLLNYGADINVRDDISNYTPLIRAIEKNQIAGVRLLLENGADPNVRVKYYCTALFYGLYWGHDEIVNLILQYGADVSAVDAMNQTALDQALYVGEIGIARILMNAGVKTRDIFYTAYEFDIEEKANDFIMFLIQHCAEIDLSGRFSLSALFYTFMRSQCYKADLLEKILLEQGYDVDALLHNGQKMTDLHDAVLYDEDVLDDLLEAGADVNAKNVLDETALYTLINYEDDKCELARQLIESGADMHARNLIGFTPFQLAVKENCSNTVNLMLAKIAGVEESTLKNVLNSSMWPDRSHAYLRTLSALDVAITLGYEEVVDKLVEMGHHMETTSNYHLPLYFAVKKPNYKITKTLLEVGCRIDGYYSRAIPSMDMTKCDTHYLEFVSLLWEFDCFSIFRKLLLGAFRHIINQPNANNLTCLLVFYYKIGLRSNKLSEDFISMTGVLRSNEKLLSILASCDDQLDELKKAEVCNNKSKLNLLTMKMDSLVKFLNDENNFKICKELRKSLDGDQELEVHECAIKIRMDLAMEKRILLDSAKNVLNEALQSVLDVAQLESLPEEIMLSILDYLNIRELKKMTVEK